MFFSGFPTITEHLVINEHDNLLYCDYCELNHIHPKSLFGALSAFISAPHTSVLKLNFHTLSSMQA
jgi:hypothetical protein